MFVTVVLPCLNEEASVGRCVHEAAVALASAGLPSEVLVVDDDSTIDRRGRSCSWRPSHQRMPSGIWQRTPRRDRAAFGGIVVMADADLTYDLSKIAQARKTGER